MESARINPQKFKIENLKKTNLNIIIFTNNQILEIKSFVGHTHKRPPNILINSIICGNRNNLQILNFEYLKQSIKKACFFLFLTNTKECNTVIFNNNTLFENIIRFFAIKTGWVYSYNKFPGGILTNQKQIFLSQFIKFRERPDSVKNLQSTVPIITKKTMPRLPEVILLTNQEETFDLQNEVKCLKIPHIYFIDTNTNNANITYAMFGNDDSMENIYGYLTILGKLILMRKKDNKENFINYFNNSPIIYSKEKNLSLRKIKHFQNKKDKDFTTNSQITKQTAVILEKTKNIKL